MAGRSMEESGTVSRYFEVSAKSGKGIEDMFHVAANMLLENIKRAETDPSLPMVSPAVIL